MATQELITCVKAGLRITHTQLDTEIASDIDAAIIDMERAGVSEEALNDPDALVTRAIKAFVAAHETVNQDEAAKYQKSYESQLDNLRKSAKYRELIVE